MAKGIFNSVAVAGSTFVLSAVGARLSFEFFDLTPSARAALAVVPVLAFGWFMWTELRAVRACDEFQQRVQLEALAVAYPLAILLVYAVGMFEAAGIRVRGFENTHDMWPLAVLPYFLGIWFARRRYQ